MSSQFTNSMHNYFGKGDKYEEKAKANKKGTL